MRLIVVACVLLCLPVSVRANDTAVEGMGGSWQSLKGEHRSVRMTRERVRIDVYRTHYQTTANFEFHNNGPATTVTMGFPESGYGDVPERRTTAFSNFRTAVDGKRVPVSRQAAEDAMFNYKAYWVKRVPFTRNQTRRVRVSYRAPTGMTASLGVERFAPYSFTGGNWRGNVEEASLTVTMHVPGTQIVNATFGNEVLALQRRGNIFTYRWKNWQAQGEFRFSWMSTSPGWLTHGELLPLRGRLDRTYMVTLPGSAPELDWAPPAVLRNGVTFIQLSMLRDALSDQVEKEKPGHGSKEVALIWSGNTSVLLRAGRYNFSFNNFYVGLKNMMNLDGKSALFFDRVTMRAAQERSLALPASAFKMSGRLYVPLAPVVRAMRGTLNVNPGSHCLSFKVPPFWKTAASAATG